MMTTKLGNRRKRERRQERRVETPVATLTRARVKRRCPTLTTSSSSSPPRATPWAIQSVRDARPGHHMMPKYEMDVGVDATLVPPCAGTIFYASSIVALSCATTITHSRSSDNNGRSIRTLRYLTLHRLTPGLDAGFESDDHPAYRLHLPAP